MLGAEDVQTILDSQGTWMEPADSDDGKVPLDKSGIVIAFQATDEEGNYVDINSSLTAFDEFRIVFEETEDPELVELINSYLGEGKHTLDELYNLSEEEQKEFLDHFYNKYPGIEKLFRTQEWNEFLGSIADEVNDELKGKITVDSYEKELKF